MKLLISLIFYFLFFHSAFGEDIKIIELHDKSVDHGLIKEIVNEDLNEVVNEDLTESDIVPLDQVIIDDQKTNNDESECFSTLAVSNYTINHCSDSSEIITLPDFWENANNDELLFLLKNAKLTSSNVLNDLLVDSLSQNSLPPKNFTKDEFNYVRITNLIELGKKEKVFEMINAIIYDSNYFDYYSSFILKYYFSAYELSQACEFSNSIDKKNSTINKDFLLKVDIFCTFIQNKVEEADFLNSLLEDVNDSDSYFQKIFLNLKNLDKSEIDINLYNHDENTMSLYSAMLRVGDIPLNEDFLKYDPVNFAMPIVLSGSSKISLRLKAAYEAYQQGIFTADSLSALYQTVDFSYDELNNSDLLTIKLDKKIEIGMAFHFQKANIQLLPITRLQTLVDFWTFAENHNLSLVAYDISRNLIETIDPSPELSEYGLHIAKAHIYNNNFELADKWILFTENYKSEDKDFSEKIKSIKLLYNLKNSIDDNQFVNILIANLYNLDSGLYKQIDENIIKHEILLTILSVISGNTDNRFNGSETLIDQRSMPSRYLLNKIRDSSQTKNFGELALSINISMINKNWSNTHPEHLKVILIALQNMSIEGIFKKLVIEILEESKII